MNRKKATMICFLIGFCFLWTGSGYLTWLYRLLDFYPSALVDVLTEVVGYFFQIIGLISFSLYCKRKIESLNNKKGFVIIMLGDYCFIVLSALAWNGPSALFFGYCMNWLHGIVVGFYLTLLVTHVSRQHRGRVFGIGYGIGSIGSWILSLIGNQNFLQSRYILIAYALFTAISIVLYILIDNVDISAIDQSIANRHPISPKFILFAGITIFLLSAVKNVGFYFPTADFSAGNVSLEFTRAFYALGLVIAGFISDWNRKYGAICCIAALVFPFAMLVLLADVGTSVILWIIGYVFFGFFVVYRVIVFVDLAGKCESNLFLAGVGLMFGRAGGCDGGNPWYLSCKSNIASCDSGGDCFCCNNICIFYFLSKNVFSDFVRRKK